MQFEATPRATATAAAGICNTIASDTAGERHAAKSQLQQQQKHSGKAQRQQEHKMQITSNEEVNCVCGLVAARVEVSPSSLPPPCHSTGVRLPHRQHASALADGSGCCKCNKKSNDVPQTGCIPPACGQDKICADNKNSNDSKTTEVKCESESSCKNDQCSSCCNSIKSKSHRRGNNTRGINKFSSNCSCFQRIATILAMLFCFTWCDYSEAALTNVNLFIEPPAVRRGQAVTLRCHYMLEGAPLYSVKFYRGNFEFFRYTPGEYPNVKVFHYPGIKVDESISNASQVVIRNVSFGLSGNFSCEVTADAPLYSTATAYAQMQVVEFPEKRPQLFTEHTRYEPGDILRANCSTPPSRPRADLRFTINNIPVSTGETQYIRTVDNLIASRLSLKLQLQVAHFASAAANTQHLMNHLGGSGADHGNTASGIGVPYNTFGAGAGGSVAAAGGLVLRCTAQIGDLYQEYKEIELGTPQKDPIPARVTLSSGSSLRNFFETYFSSSSSAAATTSYSIGGHQWRTHLISLCVAIAILGSSQTLQLHIANR